ncbi:prenyltransferase/squalene oxidase repeat-containing protein [Streptomyces sp. NBC_01198]|uniref:prenyltransferase/squalene oxidase repeat-containing protein n=1 Tax=Streptomyces sp. NBC_01198 TaxID=2903769 RepID=UPI002E0DDAC6|nr:terpene cyclase/mutase family protein [Streptomyces sp. NBC_01198]
MKIATPAGPAPLQLPDEISPDLVRFATSRLIAYISGRADPDGALRGHCESRVLESALALSLMARTGVQSPARDRLLAYLRGHQESPDKLDRVLASLAIGRAVGREPGADSVLVDTLAAGVLAAAPGFISVRRRLMVYAVLSVLGCPLPADAELPGGGQAPTDPLHSWAAVQQASITLILAGAMGVRNRATEAALGVLLATDPATTVWEGYALMHLLALHALAGLPGQQETARRGLDTLLRHQRPDGGFPFVLEMHNWCTSTGGLALHAAGADPVLLRRMAAMLAAHQGGAPLRSLSRGAPLTGGWSMSTIVAQNDVDDTACALEFLQAVDPVTHAGAVRRGIDALLAVQGADGGFPTYVAGASSEPCMTAAAICALAPHRATAPARDRAMAFLADNQFADGNFEPGWSRSRLHSLFRVRLAACTAGPDNPRAALMAERIEQTVRETQNADGGWGMQPGDPSDDISTAYGLIALCYADDPRPLGHALTWLLAQQKADGSYGGVPDMVGPRPFAYHFPLLTDIPVLLGLGHVRARLADPQSVLHGVG